MLNAGNYKGTILRHETGFSEQKGTPLVAIFFEVTHKKEKGEYVEIDPVERNMTWYFTEKTMEFVLPKLDKLGLDTSKEGELDRLDEDHNNTISFAGKEVELYCKLEPYTNSRGESREAERWDLSQDRNFGPRMKKESGFGSRISQLRNAAGIQTNIPPAADADDKSLEDQAAEAF